MLCISGIAASKAAKIAEKKRIVTKAKGCQRLRLSRGGLVLFARAQAL